MFWLGAMSQSHLHVLSKCTGVKFNSFRSHDYGPLRLEWKSKLKIVESTLKRVIQTTTLE